MANNKKDPLEMPKVSIIIPTFNGGQYITEAIDSVLQQTYKNWEIIVVDDGSTDNTRHVLNTYIEKGACKYICQTNQGVAAARNTGLKNARGDYFAFLDADDFWEHNKLELQMSFLSERPDIGLLHGNIRIYDEKKKNIVCESLPINSRHKDYYIFEELYLGNFINTLTVVVKRECIDKVGFFDGEFIPAEDYALWLKIAAEFKCGLQDVIMGTYRVHDANISNNNIKNTLKVIEVLDTIKALYPMFFSLIPKKKVRARFFKLYYSLAYSYFCKGNMSKSRKYFLMALRYRRTSCSSYLYISSSFFSKEMITRLRNTKRKCCSLWS